MILKADPLRNVLFFGVLKISINDRHSHDTPSLTGLIKIFYSSAWASQSASFYSRMYWTNWNSNQPSIQRAYLGGWDVQNIIYTDIRVPNGLAIDHRGQKLYWSDARLDKIERYVFLFHVYEFLILVTPVPPVLDKCSITADAPIDRKSMGFVTDSKRTRSTQQMNPDLKPEGCLLCIRRFLTQSAAVQFIVSEWSNRARFRLPGAISTAGTGR